MSQVHAITAIARADFLERVRRYSFLLTLLFATFLGYSALKPLRQHTVGCGERSNGWCEEGVAASGAGVAAVDGRLRGAGGAGSGGLVAAEQYATCRHSRDTGRLR